MGYRKIMILMKIIVLACGHLLSELQIDESDVGLWKEHQPIKRFPKATFQITTELEPNIPLTTMKEVAMPITAMKETKITVPEIRDSIAISVEAREPILRRAQEEEECFAEVHVSCTPTDS